MNTVKNLVENHFPSVVAAYRAAKNRRIFAKRYRAFHREVASRLFADGNPEVLTGPFRGMRYLNEVVWGSITPKWLGSYECELASIIETFPQRGYEIVVDVGCAEGYYACGLARLIPQTTVYAFDTDFISRRQTKRLARLNNLSERIHVGKYCSHEDLSRLVCSRSLLICDIEGHERELLSLDQCLKLCQYDILVEIHEKGYPNPTENLLSNRFSATHNISRIHTVDRDVWMNQHRTDISVLDDRVLQKAVKEHRSTGTLWFWMTCKS